MERQQWVDHHPPTENKLGNMGPVKGDTICKLCHLLFSANYIEYYNISQYEWHHNVSPYNAIAAHLAQHIL